MKIPPVLYIYYVIIMCDSQFKRKEVDISSKNRDSANNTTAKG
jgi:hypothetical protein